MSSLSVYAGDDASLVLTAVDAAGVAVNISTATEVIWTISRVGSTTTTLQKTKSNSGGITFTSSGSDGKFTVALTRANTLLLSGVYRYVAQTTIGGKVATASVGTLSVGPAPSWTYDPTQSSQATTDGKLMLVRELIGDTRPNDQLMYDERILSSISRYPSNLFRAAAECCRQLAAQFARDVDIVEQDRRIAYSARSRSFVAMAAILTNRANQAGQGGPYTGGISIADRDAVNANSDRTTPAFTTGMHDFVRTP